MMTCRMASRPSSALGNMGQYVDFFIAIQTCHLICVSYRQYYGATSRFHPLDANDIPAVRASKLEETEHKASEEYHRKWFASNARFQESFEKLAFSHLAKYTDVESDVCSTLLQIFWTWQAPLHNYVYRRCELPECQFGSPFLNHPSGFYRDMALGGPYFSPFLLNAIFAHACRHTKDEDPRFAGAERGDYFLGKAKQLLLVEMEQEKPNICTIQGLLILGGRQCAIGKSSEGWLYTGMVRGSILMIVLELTPSRQSE